MPVGSSGLGWSSPPPGPPGPSPIADGSELQAVVAPRARARTTSRRVVAVMAFSPVARPLVQRMCHGAPRRDRWDVAQLRMRWRIRLPGQSASAALGPTTQVAIAFAISTPGGHCCRRALRSRGVSSPAALLALVLLGQPALERREVLEDRRAVHLARAGELEQRVLPWLARAQRQHLLIGDACVPVAVDL